MFNFNIDKDSRIYIKLVVSYNDVVLYIWNIQYLY